MCTLKRLAVASLICSVVHAGSVWAEWPAFGVPVCTSDGWQIAGCILTDGSGGVILVWVDLRNGNYDIYAQRLDEDGNALWTPDGVPVVTAAGDQYEVQAVSDRNGGVLATWRDQRSDQGDIYAQRIDAMGNALWTQGGAAVCNTSVYQSTPQIVPDGAGGAVITWNDYPAPSPSRIFAQRINADGNALWSADGLQLCVANGGRVYPQVVRGPSGSLIFAWVDDRYGAGRRDIFAQRVDSAGSLLWGIEGTPMCVVPGNREQLRLVADGTGGAFAGWVDYRRGNDVSYADIYSQRIDSTGVGVWDVDGVPIDIGVGFQSGIRLVQNDPVGMALVWTRYRGESAFDIFGQMVDPVGKPLWAPGGIPVASIFGNQQTPAIDSVGDGTVIVIWEDDRNSRSSTWETISELDIYGQRMDPSGAKLWAKEGIPICVASRYQFGPVVTANAAGGAIVAWSDERASGAGTERDIYAQSVGQLGEGTFDPTPHIQRVVDVSSDQGGRVSLEWVASSFDYSPNTVVTHYSIWRSVARLDDGAAMNSIGRYVDLEDLGNSFQGPAYMVRSYGGATYVWEWLDNRESHYFDAYAYTTPTLYDSTRAGPGYHYFLVAAHTEDPFVFWDSAPDSGYSVDNLAPRSPQGLAGHYDSAPDLLTIHWHANTESDLSGYRVYRGEGADFVPSDDNLIAATPDTVVSGLGYFPADPWFIKISAVDIHGNESGFAMLPPEYVTIATFISRYGADWVRGAVEVSWSMMDEGSQFEFRVLRKAARDDQYTELACEITGQSTERLFRDATAEAGKTYSYRVLILDDGQPVTSFETSITTPPYELALYQNYPNPLNPSTRIDLTLDADGPVSLRIYDISGRIVRTVLAGDKAAGTYTEEWDGRNDIGNDVASGIYFIRLTAGNRTLTRKAVLVR